MEHAAHWPAWAAALQDSALGLGIRQSGWIYPFGNIIHVMGIALFVGSIVALDLRLLGVGHRTIKVEQATAFLTPFAFAGLALLVPGGLILFIADAGPLAGNPLFVAKIVLAALGIANAALFWKLWYPKMKNWDRLKPGFGWVQTMLSLCLWIAVPVIGRLIAYL